MENPNPMSQALAQIRANGCDAERPSFYSNDGVNYHCRCLICNRCKKHTGNSNQGHYWAFCSTLAKAKPELKLDDCIVEFHFCCPNNCELFEQDGTRKQHD